MLYRALVSSFTPPVTNKAPPRSTLKKVRLLLWVLIALAILGTAGLFLIPRQTFRPSESMTTAKSSFGGPFTLVGSDGKPFSSARLLGRPYVIYFGFTRCGDVCPTTLSRLVKLRNELGGGNPFQIIFVTIDPKYDGPREVGQYAQLFNSPIIGLTGSQSQINQVKKQFGIYAQPSPDPTPGKEMMHSAIVLLFGRDGNFVTTISPDEADGDALAKLKRLVS